MSKSLLSGLALTVAAALCGCSGGIAAAPPTAESSGVMAAHVPSTPTYGVAAHYVVYQTQVPGARPALAVLQAQTPQEFLDALHALPVPNARIVYPDGSTQRTDDEGRFDAAASLYAQRHPQRLGAANALVRAIASTGVSPRLSVTTSIFAPSAADEAGIASGAIASSVLDRAETRMHPRYAFSCTPADYTDGRKDVTAGTVWTSPTFDAFEEWYYYPLFGYCGVHNSFFDTSMVVSVRHWSGPHVITIHFGDRVPPDCIGPPKEGYVTRCLVRSWYTDATFNPSVAWASNPDVALWFEAWGNNWIRSSFFDVHLALLRVR